MTYRNRETLNALIRMDYKRRKQNLQCVECPLPSEPGRTTCKKHGERYRTKARKNRIKTVKRLLELNKCPRCGDDKDEIADAGKRCCQNCREHINVERR